MGSKYWVDASAGGPEVPECIHQSSCQSSRIYPVLFNMKSGTVLTPEINISICLDRRTSTSFKSWRFCVFGSNAAEESLYSLKYLYDRAIFRIVINHRLDCKIFFMTFTVNKKKYGVNVRETELQPQ